MGRRLILDTNVLVAYERGSVDPTVFDDDDLAIAAITVAEYRVGIELADSDERASARERALAEIVEAVEVLEYTAATAVFHARLIASSLRSGQVRGRHDLVIASHAAQTGRLLVGFDAEARFGGLPGVTSMGVLAPGG